ncbi:tRNA preQ1(34) S-adenosylmethionine ribosyltransferase-isomerase QueA [Lampropedia puyangensis]|uniref:S-adenosylmethionine:tRNA ribosyltransferase-isomerase n=1 Tax=Lampropedia puyangensis TaxID=1330072 RepID=A0A4S8FCI1_9BURK|nr:tRNA preQ1(34) S-adenosylmethionine ribosyltransferase-isomerase QueA [Lampropedia puyangensis]THU05260.1 tRNA preQ1(34) S-adenosylmethionine ribosyltransferase-isomerase QueA [Lampropedia puyangensis]
MSLPVYSLADFDYDLPEALIAHHPAQERSASRLLDGRSWPPVDRIFRDLPGLLRKGDLLVFNDTQVVKARIFGEKASGGKLEILIERVLDERHIAVHLRVSKKPLPGSLMHFAGGLRQGGFDAVMQGRYPDADGPLFLLQVNAPEGQTPWTLMERFGHLPLPPYIERHQQGNDPDAKEDAERYQTVFAREPGAVAAPTAALHFDEPTLQALQAQGVERANITLHVGAGTFQPVKTEDLSQHRMHSEYYHIPQSTVDAINACKARGGRVIAVGTTSVRTLESWAKTGQTQGDTQIFITPGFRFEVVDVLVTNFHLPKSTLMMLVSAFAGYEHIRQIYQHAIAQQYRFFSYGDSMLLSRLQPA